MNQMLVKGNEPGTIELPIYGPIAEDTFPLKMWADAVSEATTYDKVIIPISSPGGDCAHAFAMVNTIKAANLKVEVQIRGKCYSAATFFLALPGEVLMYEHSLVMIHKPSQTLIGGFNSSELADIVGMLDKHEERFIALYLERFQIDEQELRAMVSAETWLDPQDCLRMGIATRIIGGQLVEDPAIDNRNWKAVAAMQIRAPRRAPIDNKSHKMENIVKAMQLPASATEADVVTAIHNLAKAKATAEAEVAALKEAEKIRLNAERAAIINEAVEDGRILATETAEFEGLAINTLKTVLGKLPKRDEVLGFKKPGAVPDAVDRSKWTISDYLKNDGKLWAAMLQDPAYAAEVSAVTARSK